MYLTEAMKKSYVETNIYNFVSISVLNECGFVSIIRLRFGLNFNSEGNPT